MQCNKVLITTLNPSPKKALGAHDMAAELQRRPYSSTPIVTNIKMLCYVAICIMYNVIPNCLR